MHKGCVYCSILEYLGYILQAKYVVTTSFPELASCINFNKNFFAVLQPPQAKGNSRLDNLLKITCLEKRLINKDNINIDFID